MCTANELKSITDRMRVGVEKIFPGQKVEMILFGSYARGDYEEGSDIDLMILVDSSRAEIAGKNWEVGDAAAEILCDHGILVSPIVENREYFRSNTKLPFFRSIQQEGVQLYA